MNALRQYQLGNFKAAKTTLERYLSAQGVKDVWAVYANKPGIRHLATKGATGLLETLIRQTIHWANRAGLGAAVENLQSRLDGVLALSAKFRQISLSKSEAQAEPVYDAVTVLDEDWGKRGRGKRIRVWIAKTGATWQQVASEFQLAKSTAQAYIRQVRKQYKLRIAA